ALVWWTVPCPCGLSATMTAQLYPPARIIAIDMADARLAHAREFGADETINNGTTDATAAFREQTDGVGVDTAIEAVGVPATFELAAELIRPGGRVANVGVHGRPAALQLERVGTRDVTITTGLVDTSTIPQLLRLITDGRLDPTTLVTHPLRIADMSHAHDVFSYDGNTDALKVVLTGSAVPAAQHAEMAAAVGNGGAPLRRLVHGCGSAKSSHHRYDRHRKRGSRVRPAREAPPTRVGSDRRGVARPARWRREDRDTPP